MSTNKQPVASASASAPQRAALVVIDVQEGFHDSEYWGPRNNPDCERNIARLLEEWRQRDWPIVIVRHDSTTPGSPLLAGSSGNSLRGMVNVPHDLLVHKNVNSSFHGEPDLAQWLDRQGLSEIVVCGITTNHCCETTSRVGGNLGYSVWFALDATHTFDRLAPDGTVVSADMLAHVTATNLHGEFATVVDTAWLIAQGSEQH